MEKFSILFLIIIHFLFLQKFQSLIGRCIWHFPSIWRIVFSNYIKHVTWTNIFLPSAKKHCWKDFKDTIIYILLLHLIHHLVASLLFTAEWHLIAQQQRIKISSVTRHNGNEWCQVKSRCNPIIHKLVNGEGFCKLTFFPRISSSLSPSTVTNIRTLHRIHLVIARPDALWQVKLMLQFI